VVKAARRAVVALAAVLVAGALAPAGAWAHAQLQSTSPERGGLVEHEPRAVTFTFDEPVGGTQGAVRVFDARGDRVDDGSAYHPSGRGPVFAVGLKPGLAPGTYTATYRVVSADTHVVTGGFVFSIGRRETSPPAPPGATVGQLLAGQRTGTVTSAAFVGARAVQYGAIGIGLGLLAFLLAVWWPAVVAAGPAAGGDASKRFVTRLRRVLLVTALLGLLSALAGVGLQSAESAGEPFFSALTFTVLESVVSTRFGTVWTAAAAAWLLVAVASCLMRPGTRRPAASVALAGVPLLGLLTLPALAGHASVQHPVWLFLPDNLVHVAAMSVWLGGLVSLLAVLPAATRALEPAERTRLLAATLQRFSPIALGSVVVLLATGTVQALLQISAWSQLLHTAYGRAVLVKVGLLAILIALGAINRRRTVPGLRRRAEEGTSPGALGVVLRRTLRAEVALVAVVLAVTGALAGYSPAKDVATGPVQVTAALGPAQLSLDVDPARVGADVVHIYLLDPRSGAQYDKVKQLTVTATLPAKGIGPLDLDLQDTGPGHWTIPAATFGAPGTWTLELVARVSDFDQFDRRVQVRIR
jgi:copper transport protein